MCFVYWLVTDVTLLEILLGESWLIHNNVY